MPNEPTQAPAFVVGTAGHIDHGKTSLVRALTGVDLDRLPEEKRRGITIALGFTTLRLPSGRVASFVDVPGHERLVRTMIAGATGLDAVILCVSAVEGVMPQTREHLDILGLLGLQRGLVVLTMADLVDPELLELAVEDARDAVRGTFLEGAPLLPTSAQTGAGLTELLAALDALPVQPRSAAGPLRLPIDRCFVQRGFGAVVTGTIQSGEVHDGDEVVLLPSGERARVRGVQVHGQPAASSRAGTRTALNLAGVEREELTRGAVVCSPTGVPATSIFDARTRHLPGAPALEAGTRVRILLGTAEVMGVVDPLDAERLEPGASALVQLRCAEPLVALPGDRFVLRRESPVQTLGGGVVLDPWAPRVRRREQAQAVALLTRLEAGDAAALLERAGPAGLPLAEARARLRSLGQQGEWPQLADRVLAPAALDALERALEKAISAYHADHPLSSGAGRRELRRGPLAALEPAAFDALIERAHKAGRLEIDGPRLRAAGWRVQLSPALAQAQERLHQRLAEAGLAALETAELLEGLPEGEALLVLAQEAGAVEKVGGRHTARAALEQLTRTVREELAARGELSPGRFKELTGLSRKHAIPLLEWLDAQKITRRVGETRLPR